MLAFLQFLVTMNVFVDPSNNSRTNKQIVKKFDIGEEGVFNSNLSACASYD
jgi:hypothetical protein